MGQEIWKSVRIGRRADNREFKIYDEATRNEFVTGTRGILNSGVTLNATFTSLKQRKSWS
jgi:hypothetical protein